MGSILTLCSRCGEQFGKVEGSEQTICSFCTPQPAPTQDVDPERIVVTKLISRILERAFVGKERYGVPLMINDGRDGLMDALDEAIDLTKYLMKEILEREERKKGRR